MLGFYAILALMLKFYFRYVRNFNASNNKINSNKYKSQSSIHMLQPFILESMWFEHRIVDLNSREER